MMLLKRETGESVINRSIDQWRVVDDQSLDCAGSAGRRQQESMRWWNHGRDDCCSE